MTAIFFADGFSLSDSCGEQFFAVGVFFGGHDTAGHSGRWRTGRAGTTKGHIC